MDNNNRAFQDDDCRDFYQDDIPAIGPFSAFRFKFVRSQDDRNIIRDGFSRIARFAADFNSRKFSNNDEQKIRSFIASGGKRKVKAIMSMCDMSAMIAFTQFADCPENAGPMICQWMIGCGF